MTTEPMNNKERFSKKIKQYEITVAAIGAQNFAQNFGINVMDSIECAKDAIRRQQPDSVIAGFLYDAAVHFDSRLDNNGEIDLFEDALHQA